MKRAPNKALKPKDKRALIAVDLGAESCRVSLLRWMSGKPEITLVHRFGNTPREVDGGLRWDFAMITAGLDEGLRKCAAIADEGVRSIAVDGWAVDYVRVDADGTPLADPFCYRDERTIKAERSLHRKISPDRMRELTGIQLLRINTLYQLYADAQDGLPEGRQWLNLPEYVLSRWGGAPVAEHTTATHTQMVELYSRQWSREIFQEAQLDLACAPKIVPPGTEVGRLRGPLAELPAFRDTVLIAPACHDTASAIAGIPATGNDWAYISSGTWSLVGTLLEQPRNGAAAAEENFTNLGAVGGGICFHKNVNGMWLIRQCIDQWAAQGRAWTAPELVAAAEKIDKPHGLLDVDDPDLLLAGRMPQRINAQRVRKGFDPLDESPSAAPVFASLIFHSLAARYAKVLDRVAFHSGKKLKRLFVVGGASQNDFLNRLTAEATGLELFRGSPESSTVGNFAVQMAVLEGTRDPVTGAYAEQVSRWAGQFVAALEHAAPVA
ncbi:carbohydrate kinase [Edaphobacter acidisoli]|uniref:Carbohydrate kinase n=1 Tax=Edaphobacter acidisoli TaxID=2040573 RepID=A0A916RLJ9_9BACT|nr:FGGY-family carbohydrate kinase [Edaphobacter acidisoli]GGA60792.1 carbohydrate kinase [Edaphobacter acidisoli]